MRNLLSALRTRLSALGKDERGETLPGALVSGVVSGFVIAATGTAILLTVTGQNDIIEGTNVNSSLTITETSFRDDISNASLITAKDATELTVTVPGKNGQCKTVNWKFGTLNSKQQIVRTVVNYPTQGFSGSRVVCSGTAGAPIAATMVDQLVSNPAVGTSGFTYANKVNRPVTATNGTITLTNASAVAPTGVPAAAWSAQTVNNVTLTLYVSTGNGAEGLKVVKQGTSF